MQINSAKELVAYQKAYAVSMRVFHLSKAFPPEERFALTSQIRRASRSVCLNLREAWAKRRYEAHFVSKLTVFHCLQAILDHVDDAVLTAALVVRFEIALLTELGFGLDLERCAATGSSTDLVYVSPKSGRAVSASAGEEWSDKLLRLPAFLRAEADTRPALRELGDGFALSGYFLARNVLDPRGLTMPEARQNFITAIARAIPDAA